MLNWAASSTRLLLFTITSTTAVQAEKFMQLKPYRMVHTIGWVDTGARRVQYTQNETCGHFEFIYFIYIFACRSSLVTGRGKKKGRKSKKLVALVTILFAFWSLELGQSARVPCVSWPAVRISYISSKHSSCV